VKQYPRNAREEGWEGSVVIKLQILPTGKVERMELAEKSQYEILNEAALQAINKAQPFPKFYRGLTLQSITVNVPIQFTLN
jgi:protein TonB